MVSWLHVPLRHMTYIEVCLNEDSDESYGVSRGTPAGFEAALRIGRMRHIWRFESLAVPTGRQRYLSQPSSQASK
jgi:hypothetical protein